MNVKDFALLLTCFQTTWSNIVATKLPKPENVSLLTLNTQYVLTWNMPTTVMDSTVTFTTEYQAKYKFDKKKKDWTQVCVRSPETRCDLTGQPLHYLGMYVIRVRASTEDLNSDWVFKSFCPDSDAKLGPPSRVALAPVGNLLEVAISGPLDSKGESMKEHVPFLSYRLHYWSRSADPQGLSPMEVNTGTTQVTLQELEAWTWYCVRVQSRYDYYNKTSLYSPAQCMQTEDSIDEEAEETAVRPIRPIRPGKRRRVDLHEKLLEREIAKVEAETLLIKSKEEELQMEKVKLKMEHEKLTLEIALLRRQMALSPPIFEDGNCSFASL